MKFFYLPKSDRRAIILLGCIIAAAMAIIHFSDSEDTPAAQQQTTSATREHKARRQRNYTYNQGRTAKAELFPFDPNTADSTQLLRLGLQPWIVQNIYKYRQAGGVFRKPHDFARLYGLTLKQYRQLEPYIRIPKEEMAADHYFYNYDPIEERDTLRYPIKMQPEDRISLNRADTTQLRRVPGIGPHFARQIVNYRERLGGYCRVQQLLDIENFPETAVAFFVIPDEELQLRKLNLNRLSLNELKRHPYINYYQARAIIDFRRLHGRLESLQQLRLDRDFTPEAIERLEPYVEF
ncbi:MAG: helix-hairpin-helix domain-containing protein [Prevotella sp.]|nr:helix-hairpin-helix domain-containing protein [Prevotella sp.]